MLAKYKADIIELGLDYDQVASHAAKIREAATLGVKPLFPIVDTCRIDNGGIVPAGAFARVRAPVQELGGQGVAAFVPAAGAASRYSAPLSALIQALENNATDLDQRLADLIKEGAADWHLPESVSELIRGKRSLTKLGAEGRQQLARDLNMPKALLPCIKEGLSFLAMKVLEHASLDDLVAEIYVTPPGLERDFAAALAEPEVRSRLPVHFLEQGMLLSTLRFKPDGDIFLDAEGQPSPVPAGHGALAQLFPAAGALAKTAHSLFIRNIDNVMGTTAEALAATHSFFATHAAVLATVRGIRRSLTASQLGHAAKLAETLLLDAGARPLTPAEAAALATCGNADERRLWELQFRLFHASVSALSEGRTRLLELYRRPMNTFGQVPNTGRDVGGTPCFVRHGGETPKICVEVPHVSDADRRDFLANPERATHFNPVFVTAEITADADYYSRRNRDFWLLSQKNYRGHPVVYYETVLYELLGNSDLANCMFVEVPRLVFNPHKTLADAVGRSRKDWLTGS